MTQQEKAKEWLNDRIMAKKQYNAATIPLALDGGTVVEDISLLPVSVHIGNMEALTRLAKLVGETVEIVSPWNVEDTRIWDRGYFYYDGVEVFALNITWAVE